ncbi:endonuclease/exonuclease/phosphatase family protein [Planctomonas psychrotolerans]|uniref:endonuclease/exonuclease/phosphatase family protein n=1 Tax=Planctomonas psychrotolerans TaxID=2528712 RepID=UPI001238D5EB|nr:endonuclease/exonuclease/phosphatase family protein [Planctomonas psychrotolerans]
MFRRILAAATILLVAAVALIAVWPQVFGLEKTFVVAQVVSLRAAAALGALLVAVGTVVLALAVRRARRFAASILVVLLAFMAATGVVLSSRGFGNEEFAEKGDYDVTVLSWNTLGGATGADSIVDLALETNADVIALPETTEEIGTAVADAMAAAGTPMQTFTTAYDNIAFARSTTLLIRVAYGPYVKEEQVGNTTVLPTVIAVPADGKGPVIAAVHPVAPIAAEMHNWRSDLEWLGSRCDEGNVILAGDFNATLDHMADYGGRRTDGDQITSLGNCVDGALATGNAAVGTWPASAPALLGTPIDHVMATAGWHFSGFRVVDDRNDAGSDHRPVVAQLTPLR